MSCLGLTNLIKSILMTDFCLMFPIVHLFGDFLVHESEVGVDLLAFVNEGLAFLLQIPHLCLARLHGNGAQ